MERLQLSNSALEAIFLLLWRGYMTFEAVLVSFEVLLENPFVCSH